MTDSQAESSDKLFRVLATGDCVGRPGRRLLREELPRLRRERQIDFVIANIENATNGFGLSVKNAEELLACEIDVLTSGDHIRDRREVDKILSEQPRLLRPHNYEDMPGSGIALITHSSGLKIGVANLMGRAFLADHGNPLMWADRCMEELEGADLIFVDLHAEATAEKVAMGWYLDGRATAVFGTHTHVQTGDETVLPKGTGYLTDLGFVGGHKSVLGRQIERVHNYMLQRGKTYMEVENDWPRIDGAIFTVDLESKRCVSVERIQHAPDWAESSA